MDKNIDAFPLCWPAGWPRTTTPLERGSFIGTPGQVQEQLLDEIDRLLEARRGHTWREHIILSTNVALRRDGFPMVGRSSPADPGVAVYFERKGKPLCFACDKYDAVWKNMRAIQKTIEAMRGIERWGSSDLMERAFTGFAALPAPGATKPWTEVFDLPAHTPTDEVKARYRELAKRRHPDSGGGHDAFAELTGAWQAFQKERGLA